MDPLSRNEIAEAAEAAIRRHVATTDRPLEELRVLATQLSEAITSAMRHASGDQATQESVRDILLQAILRVWSEHGGEAEDLAEAIAAADLDY
jgi:preprotein translocase subunit SecA